MLRGDPTETVPKLVEDTGASLLVTDFGPLRLGREWRQKARRNLADAVHGCAVRRPSAAAFGRASTRSGAAVSCQLQVACACCTDWNVTLTPQHSIE